MKKSVFFPRQSEFPSLRLRFIDVSHIKNNALTTLTEDIQWQKK